MQLPLALGFAPGNSLQEYHPGPNTAALELLTGAIAAPAWTPLYLFGGHGVGKTHLLQAVCRLAADEGAACAYLPMRLAGEQFGPTGLEGLQSLAVICVDDLDAVAGDPVWEQALIRLLIGAEHTGARWVAAAAEESSALCLQNTELAFRLSLCRGAELHPLSMEDKVSALQQRASASGIRLPERVVRYLLRHYSTDLGVLAKALAALDYASMASQRRLTVPFVRSVLNVRPRRSRRRSSVRVPASGRTGRPRQRTAD